MWLDVKNLSSHLLIKEKTVYYLVSNGLIPHYRIGKLIRFKEEEVDQWMKTKKALSHEEHLAKVTASGYTSSNGKPGRLHSKKEVS